MRLPRRIGRYEFLELLGRGGAGLVFAGREIGELGVTHDVAIKVLRDFQPELGGRAAFEDEARLLSRIDHPNVVGVRDLTVLRDDELGEMVAIVMPRVRGESLSTLLRRVKAEGRVLPLEATLHLLSQAADALQHVHHACDEGGQPLRIVHRDIKPSNLMVTPEGDLQVLDFGIAWAAERSVEKTRNMVKGTFRYLSPEQTDGRALDGRADIYALGAVAWEAITGQRFVRVEGQRRGTAAVLGALLNTKLPQRLPELQAALTDVHRLTAGDAEHVTDMLLRMLQPDRERRFPHARAMAAALERLADRHPSRRGRRYLAGLVSGGSAAEGVVDLTAPPRRNTGPPEADTSGAAAVGDGTGAPGFAVGFALGVVVTSVVALALVYGGVLVPPRARAPLDGSLEVAVLPVAEPGAEVPDSRQPPPPAPGPPEEPVAWLAHRGPLAAGRDGSLTFIVRLQGDRVTCRPELVFRAAGSTWTTRRMGRGGEDRWQLTLTGWEVRRLPADVDYWIPCRTADGSELMSWRSEASPGWFEGGGG